MSSWPPTAIFCQGKCGRGQKYDRPGFLPLSVGRIMRHYLCLRLDFNPSSKGLEQPQNCFVCGWHAFAVGSAVPIFLFSRAAYDSAVDPESCGVDACGMVMMFSTILVAMVDRHFAFYRCSSRTRTEERSDDLRRHRPDALPGDVSRAARRVARRAGAGRGRVVAAMRCRSAISRPTSTAPSTTRRPAAGRGWCCKADVLAAAIDHARAAQPGCPVLAMTPRGTPLTQARVRELAAGPGVTILCGRFEGFDERIFEARDDRGGLDRRHRAVGRRAGARLLLLDACIRLLPGVMGAASSGEEEIASRTGFSNIRTIPDLHEWEGRTIPEVLRSGDHAKIAAWRKHRPKTIHGYAGRTFGSATAALGSSLPLARGVKTKD